MLTILLVDHEPLQGSLRKSLLEKRFSDVHRVGDAAEALCLVGEPGFASKLALVISGSHRPGMSGPDFVTEILDRMPSMRVLVLGCEGESAEVYGSDSVHFLSKPFEGEQILAAAEHMMTKLEYQPA